jgi:hypothetical protein
MVDSGKGSLPEQLDEHANEIEGVEFPGMYG